MLQYCLGLSAVAAACLIAPSALAQTAPPGAAIEVAPAVPASPILPAGTVVMVSMDEELTTARAKVGDRFGVTVIDDVADPATGAIVIPKGTTGYGEVTFVSRKGGFGKQGILGIGLRFLTLNDREVMLDGRYRQEGKSNDGAAAVTMFAVGIFAVAVQGKTAIIPKGRALKARTGEDIPFTPGAVPAPPEATAPEPTVAAAPTGGQPSASQPN